MGTMHAVPRGADGADGRVCAAREWGPHPARLGLEAADEGADGVFVEQEGAVGVERGVLDGPEVVLPEAGHLAGDVAGHEAGVRVEGRRVEALRLVLHEERVAPGKHERRQRHQLHPHTGHSHSPLRTRPAFPPPHAC